MTPHWIAHAFYILDSIESLEELTLKGKPHCQERFIYQGILRTLHTVFESAYKLPDDIKKQHSNLLWYRFAELRNTLVHDYLGNFFFEDAWQLIKEELPSLKAAMLHHVPNWDDIKDEYRHI